MPEIALNPPPFNPLWEKGVGGMRGKRAWERRTPPREAIIPLDPARSVLYHNINMRAFYARSRR